MSTTDTSEKDLAAQELSLALSKLFAKTDALIKSNKSNLKSIFENSAKDDVELMVAYAMKIYKSLNKSESEEFLTLYANAINARDKYASHLPVDLRDAADDLVTFETIAKSAFLSLEQDNTVLPLFKIACSLGTTLRTIAEPILLKAFQIANIMEEYRGKPPQSDNAKKAITDKDIYDFTANAFEKICSKDIINTPNSYDSNVNKITQGDHGGLSINLFSDFINNPTSVYELIAGEPGVSDEL